MAKQPTTIKELSAKMDDISRNLYKDLKDIKEEFQKSVSTGNNNTNQIDLITKLEIFENKANNEFELLQKELQLLHETTKTIQENTDSLLQSTHNKKILLHGIDEGDEKNIYEDVINELKNYNVNVIKEDVCNAYRLGKKLANKKRPVVLEFLHQWRRDDIFYNKSTLKGSSILITEMLTKSNYKRFQECFKRFKKDCWTLHGKTVVKVRDKKIIISNDDELRKLLNLNK